MHTFFTLDIWDAGTWLTAAQFAGVIITAYIAILWVTLAVWAFRDIRSRTDDVALQMLCVALVAFFFVPGLLLYIAIRPQETIGEAYNRRLEGEAFLREIQKQPTCPHCRRGIESDFQLCPYCRTQLGVGCASCGRTLSANWTACPYCTAEREPAVAGLAPQFRRRAQSPAPALARADQRRNGTATRIQSY